MIFGSSAAFGGGAARAFYHGIGGMPRRERSVDRFWRPRPARSARARRDRSRFVWRRSAARRRSLLSGAAAFFAAGGVGGGGLASCCCCSRSGGELGFELFLLVVVEQLFLTDRTLLIDIRKGHRLQPARYRCAREAPAPPSAAGHRTWREHAETSERERQRQPAPQPKK